MDGATAGEPRQALAHDLARLLGQMRELPVPPEALRDQSLSGYRGRPLSEVDLDFREAVDACRGLAGLELDLDAALGLWEQALRAESGAEPASGWYHGDLLAENLLVNDGRLAAVLDFGGLAVGDPSVDLMAGWEVLDRESRDSFRRAADVDDATWLKGVAWTLLIAVITFPYYWSTMPARCASRRVMAANVLAEL